jgi:hypothetical protein
MLRLCCALVVIAIFMVACRDRPPTQAVTAIHSNANVCHIGCCEGDPPNPACGEPPPPPPPVGVLLSSDHGSPILVNAGDTVVFISSPAGQTTSFAVVGYTFVPLPPAMASRSPGWAPRFFLRPAPAPTGTIAIGVPRRPMPRRSAQMIPGISSCGTSTDTVCFAVFTASGYEVVSASVNSIAQRDSIFVTVTTGLAVSCANWAGQTSGGNATVTRADSVSCKATLTNPGPTDTLVVTDWKFASSDGAFLVDRGAAGASFGSDLTVWSGQMVTSGVVTVTGTVRGAPVPPAMSKITVSARNWINKPIPSFPVPHVAGQGRLPANPRKDHELGETQFPMDTTAKLAATSNILGFVVGGPNADLVFTTNIPALFEAINISINSLALSSNSNFHNGQSGISPACSPFDVTSAGTLNRIKAHEGLNFEPGSHTQVIRDSALVLVGPVVESIVAHDSTFARIWSAAVSPLVGALQSRSARVDVDNKVNFGCNFFYGYR